VDQPEFIETERQTTCAVCGSGGIEAYRDLQDAIFGAPGTWSFSRCTRAGCDTYWLDPRPTASDIGKAYVRYYTHTKPGEASLRSRLVHILAVENAARRFGFASHRLAGPLAVCAAALTAAYPGLRPHLDLLVRYLPSSQMGAGRLLDVGCGDGQALAILRDLGWTVTGLDTDERAIASAVARGLDVIQGTLIESRFPDQTFDAVVSSHVIEHVHDPRAFLAESRRILREGGRLVAVTPNVRAYSHARHGRYWRGLEPPRHLTLFSQSGLKRLATAAGLLDVAVTPTARAVALTEIASAVVRECGHYDEDRWPGLPIWMRAQVEQWRAQSRLHRSSESGNELLLTAQR